MSLSTRFRAFRADERWRWATMVVAILVGLAASAVHWAGLFIGGTLVGLASDTRGRAILSGLGFGTLVWAVFALSLFADGALGAYLEMGQIFWVSLAIPVVAGMFAALVRWLV